MAKIKKILCLDIGGTSIKSSIYYEDSTCYKKFNSIPANVNHIPLNETVLSIIKSITNSEPEIEGIAISSAGIVNSNTGTIIYSGYTIPNYTGTKLKQIIENVTEIPCEVENDVNCACLAEIWNGSAQNASSVFCMTVGTGIGGAIAFNGKLVTGIGFTTGEIGYMLVNGEYFQDIASTTRLVSRVNELNSFKKFDNGSIIFEEAKKGNKSCIQGIDELLDSLAIGIINIMYILNPEVIILGGGIMAQKDYIDKPLAEKILNKIINPIFAKSRIEFAKHQNNAGMIGALYHFNQKYN